jgi:DNA-binding transcriptional ArsR family regulator
MVNRFSAAKLTGPATPGSPANKDLQLDRIFHALADATRRDILRRLASASHAIGELAPAYDMSLPAVSKHVRVLEGAGLVETTKEGRVNRCEMRIDPLEAASEQIEFYRRFWSAQLEGLSRYVQQAKSKPERKRR